MTELLLLLLDLPKPGVDLSAEREVPVWHIAEPILNLAERVPHFADLTAGLIEGSPVVHCVLNQDDGGLYVVLAVEDGCGDFLVGLGLHDAHATSSVESYNATGHSPVA